MSLILYTTCVVTTFDMLCCLTVMSANGKILKPQIQTAFNERKLWPRAQKRCYTLFVVRVTIRAVSTALERCRRKESGYCSEVDSGESASMHSGALI